MKSCIAALALATTSGVATAQDDPAAAAGRLLVVKDCSACHAVGRDDASANVDAPPFREVVTRYPAEFLGEALAEGIVTGHPEMPQFVFAPDDIGAIIAYLDWLAGR